MRLPLSALVMLLVLVGIGCQRQNLAERKQRAETRICSQLTAVGRALEQVAALSPSSTVGEAAAADQALADSLAALERSEQKLEALRLQTFRTQLRSFRAEVAQVRGDRTQTLEQAALILQRKAAPVIAARQDLATAVQCPDTTTARP